MKNLLSLIFASSLLFISCKKDRTCECTVITNSTTTTHTQTNGFPPFLPKTDTTTVTQNNTAVIEKTKLPKISKRKAKFNCIDSENDLTNNAPSSVPGTYTISSSTTGKRTSNCELK